MKKTSESDVTAERPNLNFSKGVRGKYTNLLPQGSNVIVLDPALLPHFPDSASVNKALHALVALGQQLQVASPKPTRRRSNAA